MVKVSESWGGEETEEDAMMNDWKDIFDLIWVGLCRRPGSVASSAHSNEMIDGILIRTSRTYENAKTSDIALN